VRIEISPIYIGKQVIGDITTFDQLTIVRNAVRKSFLDHRKAATGESVSEIEVQVCWLDGSLETLVFDEYVGFPKIVDGNVCEIDWYSDWKRECNG
jgi:hypothetical protein